jgi:hypothetical protein
MSVLLAPLLVLPYEAVAQEVFPALPEGSRVWVTVTPELGGRVMEGSVTFSSGDTLKILEKGGETGFAFGLPDVLELEVPSGEKNRAGGAVVGALAGAAAWIVVGKIAMGSTDSSTGGLVFIWTPVAMVAGGFIGHRIGFGTARRSVYRQPGYR